jgi:N-acetylmuramoyl-L-alanine amidase
MRPIDLIVLHCSATPPSMDIGEAEIDQWHRKRGYRRIGYHYVIRRSGALQLGRPEHEIGAHVAGYNKASIGICLVGGVAEHDKQTPESNFTPEQWATLRGLLDRLLATYPDARVCGHNDLNPRKACPAFSVAEVLGEMLGNRLFTRKSLR